MFVYMAYISQKIHEIIIGIQLYLKIQVSWEPWSFCNSESTGMYNRIAVHYNDSQQSVYSLNMM